jgi:hypothetical protein
MNHFMKSAGLVLVLSTSAFAAKKNVKDDFKNYYVPTVQEASFDDPEFMQQKKEWTKLKRKLASDMSFNGGDVSKDFQQLRDEWLNCKNGDEMEVLLKKSYANYNSFSEDTKYFLAQMHTALPFRGIIWRLRPLFENSRGFLGNKSTHVAAVQAVRSAISGLKMMLPTKQTDAFIQYFTEPSVEMSKADQFKSISEFQNYLMEKFIPQLNEATSRIIALSKANPQKVYVWDNKMAFGRGTFEDEVQRYVGNGPAEVNFVIASMYRAYHDVLVYCAYNQDSSIKVAGEIGSHLGIDSSIFGSRKEDFGITDQERIAILKGAAQKHSFLELRNYNGSAYGSKLLAQAYIALKNSVVYAERSFEYLQGRDASQAMALNPIIFQQEVSPNIDKGIKNMKAVVMGPAEVRDPVTGSTVTVNLPAFYKEPPQTLTALMATGFEQGEVEKTIRSKKGDSLVVRNYLHGRSIAWDNSAWKKYVPSAEGKSANYMSEARRVMQYSLGTSMVFGLPEMFVH